MQLVAHLRFSFPLLQLAMRNLQSAICNPQSKIRNPQSAICDLQSAICNPQSARNQEHRLLYYRAGGHFSWQLEKSMKRKADSTRRKAQ
jgi:hypothetical protein